MGRLELEELCRRKKDETVKLIAVADLTRQMAEAVDRGDEFAMRTLLTEREEPVQQLRETEESIQNYLLSLPEEDAIRAHALLRGGEAETEEEKALAEQTAQFRRILESVLAIDKQLSIRVGGERSFYKKFRT